MRRDRCLVPVGLLICLSTPLAAQSSIQPTAGLDAAAVLGAPATELVDVDQQDELRRPSFLRVAGATVAGGVVGGLAVGAVGYAMGGDDSPGFVDPRQILGAIGFAFGYPIGGALGARWGATVSDVKPGLTAILLGSIGGAVLGGLLWNRIGETFEPRDGTVNNTAWRAGAAVGFATHLAATTLVAVRTESTRRKP